MFDAGIMEAAKAGRTLKQNGFEFDLAFTSVLTRAVQTFNCVADELDCHHIPIIKDWRLNERHYGALQGLNKVETVEKHGKEQVQLWRRSFNVPPPALELTDPRHPVHDFRYKDVVSADQLPCTESLKTAIERVVPYWNNFIVPEVKKEKKVIVVAHGNTLRSFTKYFNNISETDIVELNIPTAIPLIYHFDQNMKVIQYKYLAETDELDFQIDKVKKQTGEH